MVDWRHLKLEYSLLIFSILITFSEITSCKTQVQCPVTSISENQEFPLKIP